MSGILEAVSFRNFWTEEQIKQLVARYIERIYAVLYSEHHKIDDATMATLLIFSTSKQQTWLVADQHLLACVLDDRRKEQPRVQWHTKRETVEPLRVNRDYSRTSGVLYFGSRQKGWLYSKNLFQTTDPVDAVKQFLFNTAG
jgi:hypothetical protein